MKVSIFLLVCVLIGCFIVSTSAGALRECERLEGTLHPQRCNYSSAFTECTPKCQKINFSSGFCLDELCCCFKSPWI